LKNWTPPSNWGLLQKELEDYPSKYGEDFLFELSPSNAKAVHHGHLIRCGGRKQQQQQQQGANNNKTLMATKTPKKRRAFGDISNQKNGASPSTIKKTPHVSLVSTKNKSKIVPPSSTQQRHQNSNHAKVTFAGITSAVMTARNTVIKNLVPVEDVELSAGRTWSKQLLINEDDTDVDVEDIVKE
jgi:hypothetical protein